MKRIVISGSQGFLGRYLCYDLLCHRANYQILGLGRSPANDCSFTHRINWLGQSRPAPIPPGLTAGYTQNYHYERVDICDHDELVWLFKDFQPHWVFHLASGLRDDAAGDLCRTNVEGSTVLTQALVSAGCRPEMVVYGSSGSVYGSPRRLPLDEETPTEANDIYGATKLAAEQVTRILTRDHSIPALWARLFNLVGPGQDERHACGYFANRISAMAAGHGSSQLKVGSLEPTRDFIDVRDAARALVVMACRGSAGLAYNIASGSEVSIGDVLAILLQLADVEGRVDITSSETRTADIPRHFADVSRLSMLGFVSRFTLLQSLRDLLDYYSAVVNPMEVVQ